MLQHNKVTHIYELLKATGSPAQIVLNSTAARRNVENVMRTLAEQGLPTSRVGMNSMSSATVQANEVRVYVR